MAMNISVNVQRKNKQGQSIGEDAFPYVSDDAVIVADGLGGMGSQIHEEMNADFFDEEKGIKMLLSVFPDAKEDGITAKYARSAFSDVFAEKRARESGYFASRFVVTALLYAIKEAKIFSVEDCLAHKEADEEFAAELVRYLKDTMNGMAKAIGLDASKVDRNLIFLPTTLSMAMFGKEKDGKIDVVTVNAGDSRTYYWNEDGLKALTKDDVASTSVMDNLVCLSSNFSLTIRRFSLATPCAVFSASDGVHDSMAFPDHMFLEAALCKLVTESADAWEQQAEAKTEESQAPCVETGQGETQECADLQAPEAKSEEEKPLTAENNVQSEEDAEQKKADACAARIADAFLNVYGMHDDSNTLAMALIGFKDFSEFAAMAKNRLESINSSHSEWKDYTSFRAKLRSMESRINRAMLTGMLTQYGDRIAAIVPEEAKTATSARNVVKKSGIDDFGFKAGKVRTTSLNELYSKLMQSVFVDYSPSVLPKALSYSDIKKATDSRVVTNYWYKNGARLVCESIAGVGTGKRLNLDMKSVLLPKVTEEIKTAYGQAYVVYGQISEILKEYDENFTTLLK